MVFSSHRSQLARQVENVGTLYSCTTFFGKDTQFKDSLNVRTMQVVCNHCILLQWNL